MTGGTARDRAEVARRVREDKQRARHEDCVGGQLDAEHGTVCGCGTILADLIAADLMAEGEPVVSATTVAANRARPPVAGHPVGTVAGRTPEGELVATVTHPADPILSQVGAIDATQVLTPAEIELHITDVVARIDRGTAFERVCLEDATAKRRAADLVYARAMAAASGAADQRKARAMVAAEVEETAAVNAEMMLRATRDTMHNLRSQLSGLQSLAKSVTASMGVGGSASGGKW